MSQVEAAVHLGVPKGIYEEAERGEIPCVPIAEMLRDDLPTVPTVAQACRLARRRSGLALASLAVGTRATTVPTVLRMEARGDPRLVTYWEDRGFVFPAENRAV